MKALYDIYREADFLRIFTDIVVTGCVLTMALAINGDWLVIAVHLTKQLGVTRLELDEDSLDAILTGLLLKDFRYFWITVMVSGFSVYFALGGFLHWYYYVRQKDNPQAWKCQPHRWLPRDMEIQEIKESCVALLVTNTWSAIVACYSYNGGEYCTIYYRWNEYGWIWFLLQFPLIFAYQDYMLYWCHRILHWPFFYRKFHYLHHKYLVPTPFSVLAVHPVEVSMIQMILIVPLFTVPVHWFPQYVVIANTAYAAVTTHSGIIFKAKWWQPWHPDTIFHDNHHQYFHVNFGLASHLWDLIHDTYRKPDLVYNEHTFEGQALPVTQLNAEQLEREINERRHESTSAYENHNNPFWLDTMKKSS